jgi:hypothetical protein
VPVAHDHRNCFEAVSTKKPDVVGSRWNEPSVPSDRVASFCSSASICVAMAALRSRSCFKCSSSAFFSLTRATNAGGGPDEALAPMEGCRMCVDNGLVGNDMVAVVFGVPCYRIMLLIILKTACTFISTCKMEVHTMWKMNE